MLFVPDIGESFGRRFAGESPAGGVFLMTSRNLFMVGVCGFFALHQTAWMIYWKQQRMRRQITEREYARN